MSRKKNIGQKKHSATVVKISLPKEFSGMSKSAQRAAVSLIVANPLAALIVILIAFIAVVIIGGFTLTMMISLLLNPWVWIVAFLLNMGFRPNTTMSIIGASFAVGFGFWIWQIYQEYQALQSVCAIPFLGGIICSTWNVAMFLPRMYGLAIYVLTAFMLMTGISYLRQSALNR